MLVTYKGQFISTDILRQAKFQLRNHLGPVIVRSVGCTDLFIRKGTRSVRASESILFGTKEVAEIVRKYGDRHE